MNGPKRGYRFWNMRPLYEFDCVNCDTPNEAIECMNNYGRKVVAMHFFERIVGGYVTLCFILK